MKRICSLILTLLLILSFSVPAVAVNNDVSAEKIIDGRSVYSYSMGEIQNLLLDFFEENNISLEPGTETYYAYICEQLLGDTDEDLHSSPYWRLFHSCMAVYKNEAELIYQANYNASLMLEDESILNADAAKIIVADNDFLSSTIGDIRNEMLAMDRTAEAERALKRISSRKIYDADAAVDYAITYADDYNDDYKVFPGADCANFVSQCLYAGGMPMRGECTSSGRYDDTTEWFHVQFGSIIKTYGYTTTWSTCGGFKKYWQTKCSGYSLKSSFPDLVTACSVGDVFQLCDEDTIVPYHSMIVSGKSGNTKWVCAHTNDRNDEEATALMLKPTENDFLIYNF